MGSIYQCKVDGSFTINSRETATVNSVSRLHSFLQNNNDVIGFVADNKSLNHFPKGLDKIFQNLQLFRIRYTSIHEISQSDFKPFPNLKELDMHENKITVLEDGLFDYNPKLVFISFSKNKIFRIESSVFDNLRNLKYLYLTENECIDTFANNDRDLVELVVTRTKIICNNKDEPTTLAPSATTKSVSTTTEDPNFEEDYSYYEDYPPRPSYRTSSNGSSLQIMFIIIFLLAIAVAGGVFYFFSAYGYRY
ncbi:hypothetical protein ACKWTF_010587 [Chironomus riparius]